MESQYLKFTCFTPASLEPRHIRVKAERIDIFYEQRVGDATVVRLEVGSSSYDVTETFEEVEALVLKAEVKDRFGT
jgi:hypothetical protein